MKIYLASRYANKPAMRRARHKIHAHTGHEVVSRWLDEEHESDAAINDAQAAEYALIDSEDIERSNMIILFTTGGGSGCFDEFGYARALGKQRVILGEPENIFHRMDDVKVFKTALSLLRFLEAMP